MCELLIVQNLRAHILERKNFAAAGVAPLSVGHGSLRGAGPAGAVPTAPCACPPARPGSTLDAARHWIRCTRSSLRTWPPSWTRPSTRARGSPHTSRRSYGGSLFHPKSAHDLARL